MPNPRLKLVPNSTPEEIRIVLAIVNLRQDNLAAELNVTPAAVSLAINNDPYMKKLRKIIIDHLNGLQGFHRRVA